MLGGMAKGRIPDALSQGPFMLDEAKLSGIQRWHLEELSWRRVAPRTYLSSRVEETAMVQIEAAALRLPPGGAFSGLTAAWLHGLDVPASTPIEITVPKPLGIASRAGMRVRRSLLQPDEVACIKELPVTSIDRTIRDVSGRLPLTEAVVVCDMALHSRLTTTASLAREVARSTGARGIATLRAALDHTEPKAESPMETRMRMRIVLAGLPRPEAQVEVRDAWGNVVARLDLFYREQRVGIEYDGSHHESSLAEDNRRQNRLLDFGITLLRFTAGDIYGTPEIVVSQVRSALSRRRVNSLAG